MRRENAGHHMCPVIQSGHSHPQSCGGASCMLWRWYQVYDIGGYDGNLSKEQGYCGLAGPQPGYRVYKKEEFK
jgi:hypothetical protein